MGHSLPVVNRSFSNDSLSESTSTVAVSPMTPPRPRRRSNRARRTNKDGVRSVSKSSRPKLTKALSGDCIKELYRFLSFKEIDNCCAAGDKTWTSSCSKKLFQRIVDRRWTFKPKDLGMGSGVRVELNQHKDWKRMVLCREALEDSINKQCGAEAKILVITQLCEKKLDDHVYLIEGMRWITEIFDRTVKGETNFDFPCPQVPQKFLVALSLVLREYRKVQWLQQLATKCVGVLSICEANRAHVEATGMAEHMIGTLNYYLRLKRKVPELMATILWSCVILCRPLGGVEGQTLTSFASENFLNVRLVARAGGVNALFKVLRRYNTEPLVLSKAFWLVVNLALVDEVKNVMLEHGVLGYIISAMKAFEDCKEMLYRACFSLINLGIKEEAKNQIRSENGLECVFAVMKRYPEDPLICRVCCNVMRSLIFGDTQHHFVHAILDLGGMEMLQNFLTTFADNEQVSTVINQTIFWLDAI